MPSSSDFLKQNYVRTNSRRPNRGEPKSTYVSFLKNSFEDVLFEFASLAESCCFWGADELFRGETFLRFSSASLRTGSLSEGATFSLQPLASKSFDMTQLSSRVLDFKAPFFSFLAWKIETGIHKQRYQNASQWNSIRRPLEHSFIRFRSNGYNLARIKPSSPTAVLTF